MVMIAAKRGVIESVENGGEDGLSIRGLAQKMTVQAVCNKAL